MVESWRTVWRAAAPMLSTAGLRAIRDALASNDDALVQGATTSPPPLACVADWPCEGACLLGMAGWRGDGLRTVAEVETYFTDLCFAVDDAMGEPAAIRWLLCWFDETPRPEMIAALLPEVELALAERTLWDGAASGGLSATSAGSTDRGAQNKTLPPQSGEPCGQGGFLGRDSTADGTPAPSVKAS